jgi:ribose 5-phosphate isomerase B
MTETIAIAADHGGFLLKEKISDLLDEMGFSVLDLGTHGEESVDYPDYADSLAGTLLDGDAKWGVLICGSGIGISIAANRHKHIRAALCHNEETAKLARQHNHANVLVLGARTTDEATALACVKTFFSTDFEDAERHHRRVGKLS